MDRRPLLSHSLPRPERFSRSERGRGEDATGANNDDVVNALIYVFIVVSDVRPSFVRRMSREGGREGGRNLEEMETTTTLKFGSRRASGGAAAAAAARIADARDGSVRKRGF